MLNKNALRVGAGLTLATMATPVSALNTNYRADSEKPGTNYVQNMPASYGSANGLNLGATLKKPGISMLGDQEPKEQPQVHKKSDNLIYIVLGVGLLAALIGSGGGGGASAPAKPPGPHPEFAQDYNAAYNDWVRHVNSQSPIMAGDARASRGISPKYLELYRLEF